MILFRYILSFLFTCIITHISHAQDNVTFEIGEEIRLKRGSIWSQPSSLSKPLFKNHDDETMVEVGGIHDTYLSIASDTVINNYVLISIEDSLGNEVNGWIYRKNIEKNPVPHLINSKADTSYYKKYIDRSNWKKYSDPENYSSYQHSLLYCYLADSYAREKLYNKSIYYYTISNDMNTSSYTQIKRALSKIEMNDYYGALYDLNIAMQKPREYWTRPTFFSFSIDYSEADVFNSRGYCNMRLKKYIQAILDFDASLLITKQNVNAYYYRGICKLNLNRKSEACTDLSKAGEHGSEDAYQLIKQHCQ